MNQNVKQKGRNEATKLFCLQLSLRYGPRGWPGCQVNLGIPKYGCPGYLYLRKNGCPHNRISRNIGTPVPIFTGNMGIPAEIWVSPFY